MLQSQTQPRTPFQPHLNNHHSKYYQTPSSFDANTLDIDFDGGDHGGFASQSSSPISTQSILSQFSGAHTSPLSTFDSIPTIAAPRGSYEGSLFDFPPQRSQSSLGEPTSSLFSTTDLMQAENWLPNGQLTPKSSGRFAHHRESSLSSLGSAGPASPYSHNISNPQIAVTSDSLMGDTYGLGNGDELNANYQLSKTFPHGITHDTFFASYPSYTSADNSAITAYPQITTVPRRKNDRGLLPPPDHLIGSNRSRPVSVASSIASDSPATPAEEPEEIRRQRNVISTIPKLDRTYTDVCNDELYSPSFSNASATSAQMPISPSNDLFNQRLQSANNQHLSAHSPISGTPKDRSPFRHGSPLAPLPMDFSSTMRFQTAQHLREQNKAAQDVNAFRQQLVRSADTSAPQTISPKDALLDYHETDDSANFPLFPQQDANGFDAEEMSKAVSQNQQAFDSMSMGTTSNVFNNYLSPQIPHALQIPQQYPFIAEPRHQSSAPSLSNGSLAPSRMSSAEVDSTHSGSPQRPAATGADGGTYTCTYHGCTLRFETPSLLQKHKREGHRQAHGLTGTRRPDSAGSGMTTALLNSQAGPHRCDRINPSTGKPCNTIFSRPYDLTRHEDTIHNARKQKVRCDLCTDEKTFSRADALTRHYRVCHPDVDFPGKQRRRGAQTG
ncbi:hypothetical protein B0H63DRAFT_142510 [Podospora didyma]|uniref:C2H2-type domain-containing protein n=1 Tax=Podospora didyma TaxID=330526 RepID=A0AAE0NSK2_9PEZI|nr:hypothetical protein B0H63DRAFT_142510 [Podospora didyma]